MRWVVELRLSSWVDERGPALVSGGHWSHWPCRVSGHWHVRYGCLKAWHVIAPTGHILPFLFQPPPARSEVKPFTAAASVRAGRGSATSSKSERLETWKFTSSSDEPHQFSAAEQAARLPAAVHWLQPGCLHTCPDNCTHQRFYL